LSGLRVSCWTRALEEAGIDRSKVYITNTVKHFKWEPRGKLRIHKKPNMQEIHACRPWLDAELETLRPKLIVCLGAVAAQALLGSSFKVTQTHGKIQTAAALPPIIATLHPSAILRARTDDDRHHQMKCSSRTYGRRQNLRVNERPLQCVQDRPSPIIANITPRLVAKTKTML
jgi:uracil-DNA glycosylase family 4